MADPTLSSFVKESLAAGKSRTEIAKALKDAGWPDDQAKDALGQFADIAFPVPVPRPRAYGSAREAFLYIVYFSLLGMVAGHVGGLAFAWIEYSFADALMRQSWDAGQSGMRWAIASLLVGFPLFMFLGWRLGARRRMDPERRRSRVRAWLTYVTLIFAAGALIGDLVVVVFQFLGGELGARFLAKAGVVGVISAAILFNYARDAERTGAKIDWPGRALAVIASVVAVALVIWAFTIVSGPQLARARIADEQRLDDLGAITRLIDCHASYFGETPESLEAMSEALRARVLNRPVEGGCAGETPVDPATQAAYSYRRIDAATYELCATFDRGWPETAGPSETRRRSLRRYAAVYGKERYVELPLAPGLACFAFEATRFEVEETEPAQ